MEIDQVHTDGTNKNFSQFILRISSEIKYAVLEENNNEKEEEQENCSINNVNGALKYGLQLEKFFRSVCHV